MKNLVYIFCLMCSFLLSSCYEDESTLGTNNVGDIVIADFEDQAIISYVGNVLELNPQIESGYTDDELNFFWYMYEDNGEFIDNGFRNNLISTEKNLKYEVNLPSGKYAFVLEVSSKEYGYAVTKKMLLSASTDFSTGYYILKETADGNTELDCANSSGLISNLIEQFNGAPLEGKPRNISVAYNHGAIDTNTNKMVICNLLNVISEQNKILSFRTEDMQLMFNNDNLLFSQSLNEEPYIISRMYTQTFMLTSAGIRTTYIGELLVNEDGEPNSSGRYSYPVGEGGSVFVQPLSANTMMYMGGLVYWNNALHTISRTDGYGMSVTTVNFSIPDVNKENLRCIASGANSQDSKIYFLLEEENTLKRYLVMMSFTAGSVEVKELDSSLHIAKSKIIAGNAKSATFIYCVDENKLYAYNWKTNTETLVQLPGQNMNETITYVTNLYWNRLGFGSNPTTPFDYLVVGTQSGNQYKLYMYDSMVGGQPTVEAFNVITGEGLLKRICFVSSGSIGASIIYASSPGLYSMCD